MNWPFGKTFTRCWPDTDAVGRGAEEVVDVVPPAGAGGAPYCGLASDKTGNVKIVAMVYNILVNVRRLLEGSREEVWCESQVSFPFIRRSSWLYDCCGTDRSVCCLEMPHTEAREPFWLGYVEPAGWSSIEY